MDNNELLIAIENMMDKKLEPINERLEKIEEKLDFVAEVLEGTLQMHDKLDQRVKELESIA